MASNAPTPDSVLLNALDVLKQHDGNQTHAAIALGINRSTMLKYMSRAKERGLHLPEGARDAAEKAGLTGSAKSGWIVKVDPETGSRESTYWREPEIDSGFASELKEELRQEILLLPAIKLPPRFVSNEGNLLVLDPADVHIGKLCVATETGYTYNSAIAEHRLFTGCAALVDTAKMLGGSHVLFVIGNDIAHFDTPRGTTTSGTNQDIDGSIFSTFRTARKAYVRAINYALEKQLSVQIVFVPSNHDWVLGFCLAETIKALFKDHPNVIASDYATSERHRKYVRYGLNIFGFTHGDGAKESDLPQIMLQEARPHMAECLHRYWYIHHYHHKIKKALGIRPMAREKDHIAMTVMKSAAGSMEGDNVQIEYVRSPSPPDGWHDRNGYLNRQAVEGFLHHPERGQIHRATEWF